MTEPSWLEAFTSIVLLEGACILIPGATEQTVHA